MNFLYNLVINPLSDVQLAKIFSHDMGCFFNLVTISFAVHKIFSFLYSHSPILSLSF
jgi:hypothetical protein